MKVSVFGASKPRGLRSTTKAEDTYEEGRKGKSSTEGQKHHKTCVGAVWVDGRIRVMQTHREVEHAGDVEVRNALSDGAHFQIRTAVIVTHLVNQRLDFIFAKKTGEGLVASTDESVDKIHTGSAIAAGVGDAFIDVGLATDTGIAS
jgi:hypothetical protein